jgi:hypothetical protein
MGLVMAERGASTWSFTLEQLGHETILGNGWDTELIIPKGFWLVLILGYKGILES